MFIVYIKLDFRIFLQQMRQFSKQEYKVFFVSTYKTLKDKRSAELPFVGMILGMK
jgi:hypothetical protein